MLALKNKRKKKKLKILKTIFINKIYLGKKKKEICMYVYIIYI